MTSHNNQKRKSCKLIFLKFITERKTTVYWLNLWWMIIIMTTFVIFILKNYRLWKRKNKHHLPQWIFRRRLHVVNYFRDRDNLSTADELPFNNRQLPYSKLFFFSFFDTAWDAWVSNQKCSGKTIIIPLSLFFTVHFGM